MSSLCSIRSPATENTSDQPLVIGVTLQIGGGLLLKYRFLHEIAESCPRMTPRFVLLGGAWYRKFCYPRYDPIKKGIVTPPPSCFRGGQLMERTAECHCGSLRAVASGDPEQVDLCHCKACQRRTGTAFHLGAAYLKARVRLEGDRQLYKREADTGYRIRFHFCPN